MEDLTKNERHEWKLSVVDPIERNTWRSGVRSAKHAANQLPEGVGGTDVDDALALEMKSLLSLLLLGTSNGQF